MNSNIWQMISKYGSGKDDAESSHASKKIQRCTESSGEQQEMKYSVYMKLVQELVPALLHRCETLVFIGQDMS